MKKSTVKTIREIGTIAVGSLVKFPRQSVFWQIQEHQNGYTRIQEFLNFVTEIHIQPSTMTLLDRIEVQLVEGF